jgi:hypothetical protein
MKDIGKRFGLTIVFILVLGFAGMSQMEEQSTFDMHSDSRIDSLLLLHIAHNEAFPVMDGFRIHIYMGAGTDALNQAEELKIEFEEKHEDVPAYITFAEPYYRVRVGDFRTRLEASQFLQQINRKYPNAWVIKEKINLPIIPKYQ